MSGFNPAALSETQNAVSVDAMTFLANDAASLNSIFFDDWKGPVKFEKTNHLDAMVNLGVGFTHKDFRISLFYKGESFLKANKDTLELVRMTNAKQDLPVGREFDIKMAIKGYTARGAEFSKKFDLDNIVKNLKIGFTARYLKGEKIQEGSISGTAGVDDAKTYNFDLSLDYVYDDNLVYTRGPEFNAPPPFSGDGYSFDFGIKYAFNKQLDVEVLFRDIAGKIYWKNVPYTTAKATPSTPEYDANGYMIWKPTISGWEIYKDFTQEIPLKTDITVNYTKGPFVLSSTVNLIEDRPFYWICAEYNKPRSLSFNFGYNLNYQAVLLGASYKMAALNIYADNINPDEAKTLGLTVTLKYQW